VDVGRENRGDEAGEMGDALPPADLGRSYDHAYRKLAVSLGRSHTCVLLSTSREGDSRGNLITCFGLNDYW
jgi:hypothetical protein